MIELFQEKPQCERHGKEPRQCHRHHQQRVQGKPVQIHHNSDDHAQSTSRKSKIYAYLTDNLGFQRSAADAIMANIEAESSFNPSIEVEDTNGLMSIGLFQWNGDRCDNFKKYCNARSLEYGSVDAQLTFLSYELNGTYSKQYDKMLGFADSADGAYNAAYYWASHFEVCASSGWEKRAERASTLYKSE